MIYIWSEYKVVTQNHSKSKIECEYIPKNIGYRRIPQR